MSLLPISPSHHRSSSIRARLRREEGATLLEFALSISIFLAVTFGIMILCMSLFTYEYVDFAAREAVRWAAVRGSDCSLNSTTMPDCNASGDQITAYVQSLKYPIVNPANVKVNSVWLKPNASPPTAWTACTSSDSTCNAPGDAVKVTVSYQYNFDIPFAGNHPLNLSSTAQMVISQ